MSEPAFHIDKLALIGVGLIGGSLVKALRGQNAVGEVVGVGRKVENLKLAQSMGLLDQYTHHVDEAVKDADVVVLATPVGELESLLSKIMPNLGQDAVVTDVGSVKGAVIDAARRAMGNRFDQFVPAHPIAGSEASGAAAARADLYKDHVVVITPTAEMRTAFGTKVTQMWQAVGAEVFEMDIELHDQVLGVTSHLPHAIVYALMNYLSQQKDPPTYYRFAAGGLYDLTRIASSDALMWKDILLNNKGKIVEIMREFSIELLQIADSIDAGDEALLLQRFERAKQVRGELSKIRKTK